LNLVTLLGLALCLTSCEQESLLPGGDELARLDKSSCININLHAYLEGAYNPTDRKMGTNLHTRGLLPGQKPAGLSTGATPAGQPYSTAPWNYFGTEGKSWGDENYTGNETDWVLISFRTDIAKDTEIARAAALMNKDGRMTFQTDCALQTSETDALYVVIEHRNHMGIMSPQPIQIENGTLTYDFRAEDSYNGNGTGYGQREVAPGTWAMYAGDADQSDLISYDINGSDNNMWIEQNGSFNVYLPADCNLDGDVNGADKGSWVINNGLSSRVPR